MNRGLFRKEVIYMMDTIMNFYDTCMNFCNDPYVYDVRICISVILMAVGVWFGIGELERYCETEEYKSLVQK